MSTPDRALLQRWTAERDADAFAEIIARHSAMVFNVCKRVLRDSRDAEEVTQEAFLELAEKGAVVRSSLSGWLHTVATHRALDRAKREKRRRARETQYAATASPPPAPAWTEIWEHVDAAIAQLPDDLKGPIVQRFLEGQTQDAIAATLGVSPSTVRYRIDKGVDHIRHSLKRSGLVVSGALLVSAFETATAEAVPLELTATLGKLALAGMVRPAAAATGLASKLALYGGVTLVKTKVLAATALAALLLAGGLYWGWQRWSRPYVPQDITAASRITVKDLPAAEVRRSLEPVSEEKPVAALAQPETEKSETDAAGATEAADTREAPAAYGIVHGIVLTQERLAAPNVRVVLDNRAGRSSPQAGAAAKSSVERTTVSDRQGRFEFDRIPLALRTRDGQAHYRIRAEAGGLFAVATFEGNQLVRERSIELVLEEGQSLAGRVVDPWGRPVADAVVTVCGSKAMRVALSDMSVTTTGDGGFLFAYMTPGQYRLVARAQGFLQQESPWLTTGTDNVVIRLDPGIGISGRVTDAATGKAVTACSVRASDAKNEHASCAETDADGRFAISGLMPDVYALRLESPSALANGEAAACPYALAEPVTVDLTPGSPVAGLELKATSGGGVAGRIVDAATGAPVANARVEAVLGQGQPGWQGVSEPSGGFRIEGLPPGAYSIKAASPDFRDASIALELAPGEVRQDVAFRLERWDGITGIVVDAAGNPVKGAAVFAVAADDVGRQASDISGESGRFGLYFPIKLPWYRTAPRRVYVQALDELAISPCLGPVDLDSPGEIVLTLAANGRIEGEVVDPDGQPLQDAYVAAVPGEPAALDLICNFVDSGPRTLSDGLNDSRVTTTFSGAYAFPSLLPGRYALQVYFATSIPDLPVTTTDVSLGAGQVLHARLVVDTSMLGSIEGRVTVNGEPSPGQHIYVAPESGRWTGTSLDAWTGDDGRYRLESILPGSVNVRLCYAVSAEGAIGQTYQGQIVDVEPGQVATADFDVPDNLAYVEGVVTTNGVPETDVLLDFKQEASAVSEATAVPDMQGYYRISLFEGTYTVDVYRSRPGYGNVTTKGYATVQAAASQTVRLDIEFAAGTIDGTLSGLDPGEMGFVALFPGDVNVPQWTLQAMQALYPRMLRSEQTPGNGPFRLADVEPGTYVLGAAAIPRDAMLTPESFLNAKLALSSVEVRAGETVSVDLIVR